MTSCLVKVLDSNPPISIPLPWIVLIDLKVGPKQDFASYLQVKGQCKGFRVRVRSRRIKDTRRDSEGFV